MKRYLFVLCALAAMGALLSCGGGSGGTSSGSIALYATDDISDYSQVIATINKVQLVHTGNGTTCDVLTTPTSLDITELSSVLQLLSLATCPESDYNRLRIEFAQSVRLTDAANVTSDCTFVSYKDEQGNPNTLACTAGVCTMDINGAVNVFANRTEKVGLDFDLKEFDVASSEGTCSVTMKASPLNASGMDGKRSEGYREGLTGTITALDTTADIFTLKKGNSTFTVNYAAVTGQNIDQLLQFAFSNGLRVKVETSSIDLETGMITASGLYVKAEGVVSGSARPPQPSRSSSPHR